MRSLNICCLSMAALSVAISTMTCFAPQPCQAQQVVNGCQVFPANNIWNRKVDALTVDANSDTYVNSMGRTEHFHPDLGTNLTYGIPYNLVLPTATKYSVKFEYFDESDVGPYPVDKKLKIEGGTWSKKNKGDRHVLMIDTTNSTLYELYGTSNRKKKYSAGSGAIFNLTSNVLRPDGWTSADAAGLPVFPGLLNYDEAISGSIKHALRFTSYRTNSYIWPARHKAGPQIAGYPPMGQRFRLKSTFNISGYAPICQTILTCLKEYGMFVADNGSNWYMNGAPDSRWNDDDLNQLKQLTGNDFEAVDESGLMVNPDSAQSN